jgi:hypothetical protein
VTLFSNARLAANVFVADDMPVILTLEESRKSL